MDRLKTGLRVGGTLLAMMGLLCLPLGSEVNPKRAQSFFENLVELGAFIRTGLALLAIGVLALGLSYVVRGE
jgi:hypothetical protein